MCDGRLAGIDGEDGLGAGAGHQQAPGVEVMTAKGLARPEVCCQKTRDLAARFPVRNLKLFH